LIFSREAKEHLHGSPIQGDPPRTGDTAAGQSAAEAWCLGPLAAADGTIRAEIVDAHLLFDADVTVPIRRGNIDFNQATVEHVGPDSSMGVSRLGVYVDAPNGRSYVYQFSSTPVSGVEFERRGAFLGAWVANRGNLRLQDFAEGLLRQGRRGPGAGFTEEARLLFDRTALSGDVQLSDGRFAAPGVEADLVGRADGRNTIRTARGVGRERHATGLRRAHGGARAPGCARRQAVEVRVRCPEDQDLRPACSSRPCPEPVNTVSRLGHGVAACRQPISATGNTISSALGHVKNQCSDRQLHAGWSRLERHGSHHHRRSHVRRAENSLPPILASDKGTMLQSISDAGHASRSGCI
jgi:hypothetical protein